MSDRIIQFLNRIKRVSAYDVVSIIPMIIGFILSFFYRLFHKNIWLICERENEARDNGYWFFKFMTENHPEIEAVYAINKNSIDYKKIKDFGKVIQFGSISHWIHYFSAKRNISSQKSGKPNAALCYALEVHLGFCQNRVYLKHGIIKDAQRWIYYDISKINLLCMASHREHEFIKNTFGYPPESLVLTGLCRYDNLLSPHEVKKQILVMPTHREWLREGFSNELSDNSEKVFNKSEYFITWNSLLNNRELISLLENRNIYLVFYIHAEFQKYANTFYSSSNKVIIANANSFEVQPTLMESAMLITDYSSIYFDFAYMKKPLIYYQFDYNKYRKGHYQQGYFNYEIDGFGPVVYDETTLVDKIKECLNQDMKMPQQYLDKVKDFYAYFDNHNCQRTYEAISNMK